MRRCWKGPIASPEASISRNASSTFSPTAIRESASIRAMRSQIPRLAVATSWPESTNSLRSPPSHDS